MKKTISLIFEKKLTALKTKELTKRISELNKNSETIEIVPLDAKTEADFFVKLPTENFQLSDSFLQIIEEYLDEETIILPLVLLGNESTKGILNSCIWNINLNEDVGTLDFELAQKQIDLTLYGSIVPKKLYDEKTFNIPDEFLPIYKDFYILNKLTKENVKVVGIPKILLTISEDLLYSNFSNEEKVSYFEKSKNVIE